MIIDEVTNQNFEETQKYPNNKDIVIKMFYKEDACYLYSGGLVKILSDDSESIYQIDSECTNRIIEKIYSIYGISKEK